MACLKTCCCCCKLKTGAIIIGVLDLLNSFIFMIFLPLPLSWVYENATDNNYLVSKNETDNSFLVSAHKEASKEIVCLIFYFYTILEVVVSIVLIIGAVKGWKWYLTPWVTCQFLRAGAYFFIFYFYFHLLFRSNTDNIHNLLAWVLLLSYVLEIYFLIIVIVHFAELRKEKKSRDRKIYLALSPGFAADQRNLPNVAQNSEV